MGPSLANYLTLFQLPLVLARALQVQWRSVKGHYGTVSLFVTPEGALESRCVCQYRADAFTGAFATL